MTLNTATTKPTMALDQDEDLLLSVTMQNATEEAPVATTKHQMIATTQGTATNKSSNHDGIGQEVVTRYGTGKIVEYRAMDAMYTIVLESGAKLYSREYQPRREKTKTAMELNVAYESLEKMRRLNLEMQVFEEKGVSHSEVDFDKCTTCVLTKEETVRFPRLQKMVDDGRNNIQVDQTKFPRIHNLWKATSETEEKRVVLPRIQKMLDERQKANSAPCLICASPSCPAHSSPTFRKENITLCLQCERMFELDFIVDCVSAPNAVERAKHVDHMVDLYDRSLLLLRYSCQYIDSIAAALETSKEQQNKIGLGSSGVGLVSGTLGIAAAATILTPAGPPLLIASLLFGGSATAVQTGTEVRNYYSEPSKLAARIIALHGISKSILRVTSTLRDAMMRDHIRTDEYENQQLSTEQGLHEDDGSGKRRAGLLAGANVGRSITLGGASASSALTGAEVGVMGTRSATALSRAGTAAARTIRFARFAGGALSAAVLVMEANSIQSTITQIRAGNPCEKADALRKIRKELDELPTTEGLDRECQAYLKTLSERRYPTDELKLSNADVVETSPQPQKKSAKEEKAMAKSPRLNLAQREAKGIEGISAQGEKEIKSPSVKKVTVETPPSPQKKVVKKEAVATKAPQEILCDPGATIIEGETTDRAEEERLFKSSPLSGSKGRLSLLKRIQMHKMRESEMSEDAELNVKDHELRKQDLNLIM